MKYADKLKEITKTVRDKEELEKKKKEKEIYPKLLEILENEAKKGYSCLIVDSVRLSSFYNYMPVLNPQLTNDGFKVTLLSSFDIYRYDTDYWVIKW